MSDDAFDGKVALVTGGSTGIGRATALAFAERGADVIVADVNDEKAEETVAQIRDEGVESLYVRTDVSSTEEVDDLFDTIESEWVGLDYAFNNAGIEGEQAPTGECSLENWKQVLDVNLDGVFYCLRKEIGMMLEEGEGEGAIVNMSSVAGLRGFPGLPAYVASKHGVVGLTKAAALEYAETGLRINAVCPGVIDTEMIDRVTHGDPDVERQYVAMEPVGRMGEPEEVADSVLWLCSDEASFVQGETLAVDGGFLAK
jgi:NAD(P)-dependent dehydrogenase (short-subunit alcohol dehydrogenase family)